MINTPFFIAYINNINININIVNVYINLFKPVINYVKTERSFVDIRCYREMDKKCKNIKPIQLVGNFYLPPPVLILMTTDDNPNR